MKSSTLFVVAVTLVMLLCTIVTQEGCANVAGGGKHMVTKSFILARILISSLCSIYYSRVLFCSVERSSVGVEIVRFIFKKPRFGDVTSLLGTVLSFPRGRQIKTSKER